MLQVWITTEIADKLDAYMVRNKLVDVSEAIEKMMSEIGIPVTVK